MNKDKLIDYINDNLHELICEYVKTDKGNKELYEFMDDPLAANLELAMIDSESFNEWCIEQANNIAIMQAEMREDK